MAQELRADTEVNVPIGPFVSIADGVAMVTTLDIGTAQSAKLIKHGATAGIDISSNVDGPYAASTVDGMRYVTLTTSDTDTKGNLTIVIEDEGLALPVVDKFEVVSQESYDRRHVDSSINDLTAAEVNAEIVDALSIDVIAELTGDPGATPTITNALMFLYMVLRNLRITDANDGDTKVHNDAGTEILNAVLTDTVTTFTKAKFTIP